MRTTEVPRGQGDKKSYLWDKIRQSSPWRSLFRQGYPNTDENRALVMFNTFFLHIHPVNVKRHSLKISYTWGLGVISFFLLLVLVGTGAWLMFFYVPSVERAYTDMQNLETAVTFGILMRGMHRWAAHLMVVAVFLHMCRVFYTGSYKHPREFNWVIGVSLWVLTLLLSFTGYLLPWDQLSYWAITVSANIVGSFPFIGEEIRLLLLGASEAGQQALIRFYTLHIAIFPVVMTLLLGVHFWRIRKDGGLSSPQESTENEPRGAAQ
ncbi:MAG: cytochrome b N-terminal domain-containing protein [Dehalococcoidales bacterium]|jgi:quinol-cytochrome oxidoreductase complex cytochrome b subunit|nr:cytochrome b N-terminal domain-containing protein [Dehalococcoidales bacterium]